MYDRNHRCEYERRAEVSGTIEETRAYIDKLEYQMRPLPEEPQ